MITVRLFVTPLSVDSEEQNGRFCFNEALISQIGVCLLTAQTYDE